MTAADVRPRTTLLPGRSYIALVALVVVCVLMTGLGVAAQQGWIRDNGSKPAAEACQPPVPAMDASIWSGARTGESEAVFAAGVGPDSPVVAGQDGFVFWGDVQLSNFSQILGRAPWLDDQRDAWLDYFLDLRQALEQDGTRLLIVIPPSPGTVYPQMLPEWSSELRGTTHLDQLLDVSGDLPIVDVRTALADASQTDWTFSAVNSHWTPYGAYAAWEAISACLAATYPDAGYDAIPMSEVVGVLGTEPPNEFAEWGFEAPRDDWTEPTLSPAAKATTATRADGTSASLRFPDGIDPVELPATTTGGTVGQRVLVVGDSQSKALSALWAQGFSSTVQIRHFLDDDGQRANVLDAARQAEADLVVLQIAERFLGTAAPQVRR
ncbi:MAG: alginate O-acetyltransferase AlgX-related protein [Cellulomonadaceae bacterium]